MFGRNHDHDHHADRMERMSWFAAGRFGGARGGPFGSGMRGGGRGGAGDMLRAGRILGDGDLKLITLYLLAEAPRHGYDIIKALEERTSGAYSPSPGVVYPTLTFLEEAGYAESAADGAKKVFSITEAGAAHLAESREEVARMIEHLERFGRKMAKAREWFGWDNEAEEHRGREGKNPPQLRAMRHRLRAALAEVLDGPAERHAEAISILQNAVEALETLARR